VARFNSDGTLDPTFDPGAGTVSEDLGEENNIVFNLARQNIGPDEGKIIIQGSFTLFDNNSALGLARLNGDGSFDSTFNPGTASGGFQSVWGILVQPDDRLVVFGVFNSFNGTPCSDIVRLNSDGSVDSGFHTAAFTWYGSTAIIFGGGLQTDGKIVVGGSFHSLGAATTNNVVRLNTDGSQDATFNATGSGPSGESVNTLAVRPGDGKIFLGGNFSTYGGQVRNNVVLANSDGTVDNSLADLGGVTDYNPNILAMVVQPDGKILITGIFNSVNGTPHYNVLRLNPDSTVDSSFNVNTDRQTLAVLLQPDGKVVIAGSFGQVNGVLRHRIARVNADGTVDLTFDPGTGPDHLIRALAQDSAGNIYAGGDFSGFNGIPRLGIIKLTPAVAVDPAFNPAGGGANQVWAITPPDSAGHIVIGGMFSTYNGTTSRHIARIDTTTGAIDPNFHTGSGFTGPGATVNALLAAPDGKYYAGGNFSVYQGVLRRRVARLNNDGTLDFDFADPGMEGIIYSLALQNGKVYAGGNDYFAAQQSLMVRFTSTGTLDPSFNTGLGFGIVPQYGYGQFIVNTTAMAIQADGKLLVGGIFNQYNGTPRICLARLTGPLTPPPPTPTATPSPATPTPTPSTTPTPTATPTATPTPTPTPTATPSPSPGRALNMSTRMLVQTGDGVSIGGFIITGSAPKQVTIRGIGPSLAGLGVPNPLADPILELHGPAGFATVINDNWTDSQDQCLATPGLRPTDPLESALCGLSLDPGSYTAILRGKNDGIGIGLVEVYDLGPAASKLANISTRGFVGTGANVMIGGFILGGGADSHIAIFGMGPSLGSSGVSGTLADPTLELRDSSGALVASNDNCGAASIHPLDPAEACIDISLPPDLFTAILAGKNGGTGIALLEIYHLQ
jgi:uncharacterized delta-60 repeat protein